MLEIQRFNGLEGDDMAKENHDMLPAKPIRRFDVFAEYTRLERIGKDYSQDEAKGYGIWLAKVVAARKFSSKPGESKSTPSKKKPGPEPKFREIGDELQTDEVFDHDIVDRMGMEFHSKVFTPAIEEARDKGEKYEDIRDSIRKESKPATSRKSTKKDAKGE
jgi:hypothetical protein